ncbi:hypothetical protein GY45DRAFT_1434886 [Cubamyces sp. BRFM 1775]|nr:hypothetical protein GY45DRAFT_1434886 [Cubamyces sp. BRFM 1775]
MQRRTSQTFQRLRKISDSLIQAIAPTSSRKSVEESSFFDYERKGWHPPLHHSHSHSSTSHTQRCPKPRQARPRISKEDIRYPLIPQSESLDVWAANASTSTSTRSSKPVRPSRPREEDLPYGAKGSIPKALAPPYVAPPPAIAQSTRVHGKGNSVPFPESDRETRRKRVKDHATREKPLPIPPGEASSETFFNPFRAVPHHDDMHRPDRQTGTGRTREDDPRSRPSARTREPGVRRISSSGDVHLPSQHARYRAGEEDGRGSQGVLAQQRHPDLRQVRSTPLRLQENAVPVSGQPGRPVARPGASPLRQQVVPVSPAFTNVVKPHPRNVPRDVSPDNPQRLPTPRLSGEGMRPYLPPSTRQQHQQLPLATSTVVAQAQSAIKVQHSVPPRNVEVASAPEHLRALSMKAQLVRPDRAARADHDQGRQPQAYAPTHPTHAHDHQHHRDDRANAKDRERGRARPTHTRAIEVEYYGMSDAFTQEITLALAEPERAHPLPLDWKAYVATGPECGPVVRPLVTKKSRLGANALGLEKRGVTAAAGRR